MKLLAATVLSFSLVTSPAQRLIGDFSPKLVELTDKVLFGDVWARPQLSPRDRSLVTVSALIAMGRRSRAASAFSPSTCWSSRRRSRP